MRSILNFILCSQILIAACSCSSLHVPYIQKIVKRQLECPFSPPSSTWLLDNLEPDESSVLIKRSITPITIHMEASGEGHYILELSDGKRNFRPFVLKLKGTAEEISFSGDIKWYIKAKGKTENISIRLYLIEETTSRKTKVTTLLKQYRREYKVQREKSKK